MDHFDDIGPSVVMASPGMIQNGLSRELFESWCTDKRNGVIIAGYCVEGTLAKVSHRVGVQSVLIECWSKSRWFCGMDSGLFCVGFYQLSFPRHFCSKILNLDVFQMTSAQPVTWTSSLGMKGCS